MKIIGLLLILNSIALTALWITKEANHNKGVAVIVCTIAVFAGLALILQDRITELTVKGVGTIKAATKQVESDAKTVSDLKERVENQSSTVDLIAKEASAAKKISEEVSNKNKQAEIKLETLDNAISKASNMLSDLDDATEYTMTVLSAQNDDRKAFDKLNEWSKNENHRFSSNASKAWIAIFESHNKSIYTSGFTVPWTEGTDPTKFSIADLGQQYNDAPDHLKIALLEYIWKRNDILKYDRLDFLINVMKNDPSLNAVEYAGRYFTSGTNQKIKPMAIDYLVDWWNEHKNEYKDN